MICRKTKVFLGASDFFSQGLILFHKILHFSLCIIILAIILFDPSLVFLEFLEGFWVLSIWKPDIFLSISDLISKASIFLKKLLDLSFQCLTFLIICINSVLERLKLFGKFSILISRKSKIFLGCPNFFIDSHILIC